MPNSNTFLVLKKSYNVGHLYHTKETPQMRGIIFKHTPIDLILKRTPLDLILKRRPDVKAFLNTLIICNVQKSIKKE
jgi:hypothetical protein